MNPLYLAGAIGAVVLLAGLVGQGLQRVLPESFTSGGARDMIGAVAGLLTLLSALVLGLLIWTAFGVYSGQNLALQSMAGKLLQLDIELADYGPDANPVREKLKASVANSVAEIWGSGQNDSAFVAENLDATLKNMQVRDKVLASLHPQSDEQKQTVAGIRATAQSISESRVQMALALSNPISFPLLCIVAGWVSAIFLGYGLMSKGHVMTVISTVVGAIAIASAFFLILELSVPYEGLFRVSSAPLQEVMAIMSRDAAKN